MAPTHNGAKPYQAPAAVPAMVPEPPIFPDSIHAGPAAGVTTERPFANDREKGLILSNYMMYIKGGVKRGLLKHEDGKFNVEAALYSILGFEPVLKDDNIKELCCKMNGPFMNDHEAFVGSATL